MCIFGIYSKNYIFPFERWTLVKKNPIIYNLEMHSQSKLSMEFSTEQSIELLALYVTKYGTIFPVCCDSENKWEVFVQILYWWNW